MGDSGSDQYPEEDSDNHTYNPFLESDHGGDTPKTMSDYPTTESSPPDERSYSPKKNLLEEKSGSRSESDESKSDESTARSESVLEAFPDVGGEDSPVLEAGRSQPVLDASTFRSESVLETSQSVFQNDLATVSSTSVAGKVSSTSLAGNRSLPPPGNILGNRSSFLETLQTQAYRRLATVFPPDPRVGHPFLRSLGAATRSQLLPAELAFGRVLDELNGGGGISIDSLMNLRDVILSGPADSLVEVANLPVMYVVERLNSLGQRKVAIRICDSHPDATHDIVIDFARDQLPDTPVFCGFDRVL